MSRSRPVLFSTIATLALSLFSVSAFEEQILWRAGKDGYHSYRIPALLVTPEGSVLAFCEGRKTSQCDHGDVDLILKRSTDGGKTWSDQLIVHEEGDTAEITIGNPCPVVDETTGTIWLPFTRDNKRVFITSSDDDGLTWSEPRDLSAEVTKPEWNWVAAGPGVGIQLQSGPHKGRLVIPSDHRIDRGAERSKDSEWNSHIMFSDDHGKTWQIGDAISRGGNECQVVERADGSLLLNTRMQGDFQGHRGVATSTNGGESWTPITHEPQLPCPKCQASLIRLRDGSLLFSNPDPGEKGDGRVNLTIRRSDDEGSTWPIAKRLRSGPSAYSSLAELPDGTILCLYETGKKRAYETLTLARFSTDWLAMPSATEVLATPDLVAFWDFQEPAGAERLSHGPSPLALQEREGPINRIRGGVFGPHAARIQRGQWFMIPRAEIGPLNLHGKEAQVTVMAWVKREGKTNWQAIAGVWDETRKKRQYCLFLNAPRGTRANEMKRYPLSDRIHGHVSAVGGPTPGEQFCITYSSGATEISFDRWHCLTLRYDGRESRVYVDGKLDSLEQYNPFPYPDGLFDGGEDGGDFTVGAVHRSDEWGNFFDGRMAGLAVFSRALDDAEIAKLGHTFLPTPTR